MKVLVTGGVRSGKSAHAESLLAEEPVVTYVAPGDPPDPQRDADWAARVARHQERRPAHWTTEETRDLAGAIGRAPGAVIVDCLGTWVTGVVDEEQLWEADAAAAHERVLSRFDAAVAAVASAAGTVVLVTNEVGLGVVPEHRSGRLFRDLLGTVNQRAGQMCDEVHLVVAGRVLRL